MLPASLRPIRPSVRTAPRKPTPPSLERLECRRRPDFRQSRALVSFGRPRPPFGDGQGEASIPRVSDPETVRQDWAGNPACTVYSHAVVRLLLTSNPCRTGEFPGSAAKKELNDVPEPPVWRLLEPCG